MRNYGTLAVLVITIVASQWISNRYGTNTSSGDLITSTLNNQKSIIDALGRLQQQLQRMETLQMSSGVSSNPETGALTVDASMLKDTLQTIVEHELDKISPAINQTIEKQKAQETYVDPVVREEAYMRSSEIIDNAIASNQWDMETAMSLAPMRKNLSYSQKKELMSRFINAINRGEITMNDKFLLPRL